MTVIIKPIPFSTEGPQPLLRPIAKGEAYPVAALGPLEAAVRAVHDKTQAPVAIAAQSALPIDGVIPFASYQLPALETCIPMDHNQPSRLRALDRLLWNHI